MEYVNKYAIRADGERQEGLLHGILHSKYGGNRTEWIVSTGICKVCFDIYKSWWVDKMSKEVLISQNTSNKRVKNMWKSLKYTNGMEILKEKRGGREKELVNVTNLR